MSYRDEVMALRAYGSPEADDLRDKAASIAARADARIAELVELVDGAEEIVEIFAARSPSQAKWKRQWLERARRAIKGESGDAGG